VKKRDSGLHNEPSMVRLSDDASSSPTLRDEMRDRSVPTSRAGDQERCGLEIGGDDIVSYELVTISSRQSDVSANSLSPARNPFCVVTLDRLGDEVNSPLHEKKCDALGQVVTAKSIPPACL